MYLTVARVGRSHGLRGEVTVEVRTDVPERRFTVGARLRVVPGPAGRTPSVRPPVPDVLTVRSARDHSGVLVLAFDEVGDRDGADALRGVFLESDVSHDEPEPDAWYDHEIVGLRAVDPRGGALGEVVAVEHGGAQDLLVVLRPDGMRRLVPFVTAIVPTVDLPAGFLVIDPPGGLLDDLG